jgi:hypothetical protein
LRADARKIIEMRFDEFQLELPGSSGGTSAKCYDYVDVIVVFSFRKQFNIVIY